MVQSSIFLFLRPKSFKTPQSMFFKTYRRQLMATLTVSLIAFSYGIALGWVTPMLYKMQSEDTPLPFTVTVEDVSWVGSLNNIGGMFGTLFFGYILTHFGSKICFFLLSIPQLVFWALVLFTSEVSHLYIARLIGGISGGAIFLVAPIYVSEFADPQVRGALGSVFALSMNFGVLSGFIIASYVPYHVIPCVILVLPVLFIIFTSQFPETPRYLLRAGKTEEAENAFKFYQNFKSDQSKEADLKFNTEFNELKMAIESSNSKDDITFKDFCSKRSLKSMGIGIVLIIVKQFSGSTAILTYSTTIFGQTDSAMDPFTNTIVIGLVQCISSCITMFSIDKYGRKFLLLVSKGGICLALASLGAYSYIVVKTDIHLKVTWLPLLLMSLVVFIAYLGIQSVSFVILVELLPPKIRSWGSTFFVFTMTVLSFVNLFVMPILMERIGLYGVMWIYAGITGFGFFFDLIFLKDTKGKSMDE